MPINNAIPTSRTNKFLGLRSPTPALLLALGILLVVLGFLFFGNDAQERTQSQYISSPNADGSAPMKKAE